MKAIMFDLDGVLYQGGSLLTGAVEALDWVRRGGIDHLFLTNTSSRPRAAIRENLARMGIRVSVDEILTPAVAARDWLLAQGVSSVALFIPEATRPECRRARDTFWDIPVPKMTALGDSLCAPVRPASVALRRHHRKLDAGFAPLPQMA